MCSDFTSSYLLEILNNTVEIFIVRPIHHWLFCWKSKVCFLGAGEILQFAADVTVTQEVAIRTTAVNINTVVQYSEED